MTFFRFTRARRGNSADEGKEYWELGLGKRDLWGYASRDSARDALHMRASAAHDMPCTRGRAHSLCICMCGTRAYLIQLSDFISVSHGWLERELGALMEFSWYHWDSDGWHGHYFCNVFLATFGAQDGRICSERRRVPVQGDSRTRLTRFRVCLR